MDIAPGPIARRNPMVLVAALFVAAGGFVHLREWLSTYSHVPAGAPGAFVVRVGFPLNALASLALSAALLATMFLFRGLATHVAFGALAFQAASLAVLIASRTGSVLGWAEPVWTDGANHARALEIGAMFALASVLVLRRTGWGAADPSAVRGLRVEAAERLPR